ncbi:hemolysin family protein [Acidipropionibacterium timonense]|uniref:hemolysin family protein n=1 Tax=Acidipropionibacterium timonense TaxID=2161818 RepID=UPI001030A59F|nr:hemolysin family protein [Acidipropionibacterium timonense]
MSQVDWVNLALAFVFALVASLFANAEAALGHLSHSRAVELAEDGRPTHRRLVDMTADPAPFINTSTLVRTCAEMASVVLVAVVVFQHVDAVWQRVLVTAAIMVAVSFLLWGVAPRTLGKQHDVAICSFWSRPWTAMSTILGPLASLLILIGNAVTPGRGFADGPFTSEAELREMVDFAESSDLIEAGERDMIHSVFDLGDTLLKEVMVPRTDVVFIKADKTLRQALSLALRSGFSRVPVIGKGLDDVLGVVYLKDIVKRIQDKPDAERTETVDSVMRPAVFSPDSRPVDDVLRDMQRAHNHITIVVDEFGGTAGLATIEDILEEIVGEIVDEYDAEPTLTEEVAPGVFRISSRLPVDDLGELFDLKVDDDDVETVGGLMAKELSVVPIPGSTIVWEGLEITAEKASGRRHQVDTCLVRRAPDTPQDQETDDDR